MSKITLREIKGDEMLDIMYWIPGYSLNPSPPMPDREERRETMKARKGAIYYALFEDGEPQACAASTAMTQNVRDKIYPIGGIWGVATHPQARRKGYQRQVFQALMEGVRAADQPLSGLYPFRGSFYERLGYVTFPVSRGVTFDISTLLPLAKADFGGQIDLQLIGDGYDAYREYLRVMQERIHGFTMFKHGEKERAQSNTQWVAFAIFNGEVEGLMLYDLKGDMPTRYNFRATRFYYLSSRAKYQLLAWIARHIDQADTVELWLPPFEHPETWLADMRFDEIKPVFFSPMGRVVDVAALDGMHTGKGKFSIKITDNLCPWNESVWQFETVEGRLRVSEGGNADCSLVIQGLAALVYGTQDPGEFQILGWGDPSEQVQEIMRGMFPGRVPYVHEMF